MAVGSTVRNGFRNFPPARRLALALVLGLLAPLGGCQGADDVTGSIGPGSTGSPSAALPTSDEALRAYADEWGKRYDDHPGEKIASINYARALRALTGRRSTSTQSSARMWSWNHMEWSMEGPPRPTSDAGCWPNPVPMSDR